MDYRLDPLQRTAEVGASTRADRQITYVNRTFAPRPAAHSAI